VTIFRHCLTAVTEYLTGLITTTFSEQLLAAAD